MMMMMLMTRVMMMRMTTIIFILFYSAMIGAWIPVVLTEMARRGAINRHARKRSNCSSDGSDGSDRMCLPTYLYIYMSLTKVHRAKQCFLVRLQAQDSR